MRRVKAVPISPNPLFEQWLEEWKTEAIANDKPFQHSLNKALKSLKLFPLTLHSGAECRILKGFGVKVCDMIDNRLEKFKRENPEFFLNNTDINQQNLETMQRRIVNANQQNQVQKAKKPRNNGQNIYLPKKGTGPNAILVTLLENSQKPNYPGYMFREDLMTQAQKYCDSRIKGNATNHYGAWSCMSSLMTKGYIKNDTKPAKYFLTTAGIALATQCRELNLQYESCDNSPNFTSSSLSNDLNLMELDNLPSTSSQNQLSSSSTNSFSSRTSSVNNALNYQESEIVSLLDDDLEPWSQSNCYKYPKDSASENKKGLKNKNTKKNHNEIEDQGFLEFENEEPELKIPKRNKHFIFSESFDDVLENNIENSDEAIKRNENTLQSYTNIKEKSKTKKAKVSNCENINKIQKLISSDDDVFYLSPNDFDIILLVDCSETSGKTKAKNDLTISELNQINIKYEVRRLNVGDFLWIARSKDTNKELVLPYIIERKRLDDLASSMKDGRYHEQKFRLKQCGVKNIIYLIEYMKNLQASLPINNLTQGIINTSVIDNFTVKCTKDLRDSIQYLSILTEMFLNKYKNQELKSCKKSDCIFKKYDCPFTLMEFAEFNKTSSKMKKFKVNEMFLKQLIQLRGLSVNMAIAITEKYPTPQILIDAYNNCISDDEKEQLLTNIEFYNNFKKMKIGTAVSKTICNFYTKFTVN